jgi:hypothetical protein
MLNWKLFNPRDVALILVIAMAIHFLAKPLYLAIDGATDLPAASGDDA